MTVSMKIRLHSEEHRLRLWIPNRLVMNSAVAWIVSCIMQKRKETWLHLTTAQIKAVFSCVLQCKKQYPDLLLVDVTSADGEDVKISL